MLESVEVPMGLQTRLELPMGITSDEIPMGLQQPQTNPVPYKAPTVWETISDIAKAGADVYKTIATVKYSNVSTPYQVVKEPYVLTIPDKEIVAYQPQSQLPNLNLSDITGAIRNMASAPQLVQRGEQMTAKVQYTGWIIAGVIVLLIFVLLTRR